MLRSWIQMVRITCLEPHSRGRPWLAISVGTHGAPMGWVILLLEGPGCFCTAEVERVLREEQALSPALFQPLHGRLQGEAWRLVFPNCSVRFLFFLLRSRVLLLLLFLLLLLLRRPSINNINNNSIQLSSHERGALRNTTAQRSVWQVWRFRRHGTLCYTPAFSVAGRPVWQLVSLQINSTHLNSPNSAQLTQLTELNWTYLSSAQPNSTQLKATTQLTQLSSTWLSSIQSN